MIVTFSKDYTPIECYKCGVVFAISKELNDNLTESKGVFHCPSGHGQSYVKSTAERLREEAVATARTHSIEMARQREAHRIEMVALEKKLKAKKRKPVKKAS